MALADVIGVVVMAAEHAVWCGCSRLAASSYA
jgi:hypothetical protein